jgi:Uma2 family endonuclease
MTVSPRVNPNIPQSVETGDPFPYPPTNLPVDDGEPLETKRHRTAMNILIRSLDCFWGQRNDYFAGGNMFLYFSAAQVKNKDFRGPDFFVVLNIDGSYSRQSWTVWDEEGRYPDVIVELMSASTKEIDLGRKKELYQETFRTPNYFVFDPFDPSSLQGWRLEGNRYVPLEPNGQGWLRCEPLGLWLGTWEGTIERETAQWLRFYNEEGQLVLLPEEAAQQRAEAAQQQAEAAQQRAEAAQQQAEAAQQQAEAAQQQAEAAQQRSQELEALLEYYREQFGDLSQ